MAEKQLVKTLKVRVRDKHAKRLIQMSRSVNFVWNYINELSHRIITEKGYFPNYNELEKYTKGCNKELGLHSQTVQNTSFAFFTWGRMVEIARSREELVYSMIITC